MACVAIGAIAMIVAALATGGLGAATYWLARTTRKELEENKRLISAAEQQAIATDATLNELRKDRFERRATLGLQFAKRFPMWWPEQNWVRVEVSNTGPAMASNVMVTLEEIRPVNPMSSRGAEHNVLPSRLGWKGHKEDHCDINPTSREYFDLLKFIPATDEDNQAKIGFTTHESMDIAAGKIATYDLRHNYQYELVLAATAANADPVRGHYRMKTDPNGRKLEFGPEGAPLT